MKVLDHGYIELIDTMGDDASICDAARTSFDNAGSTYHRTGCSCVDSDGPCNCETLIHPEDVGFRTQLSRRDRGLIKFLMKHRHGTPFEMVQLKFAVEAPIFVFREWHRHRIASINEMSGRYVELERKFYTPHRDDIREQVGKPGAYSYERMDNDQSAEAIQHAIWSSSNQAFTAYQQMLNSGVAKEVARLVLPVNTYSKMIWSANLRAVMNFLSLRNAPNAQLEIRKYAEAMEEMVKGIAPVAMQAFIANGRVAP